MKRRNADRDDTSIEIVYAYLYTYNSFDAGQPGEVLHNLAKACGVPYGLTSRAVIALEELGLDEHGGWEDTAAARRWARATEELDLGAIDRSEVDRLGIAAAATVRSHAGPWNHSVVYQAGEVVWCPTTGDTGAYTTEDLIDDAAMLVVCRPYEPGPDELLAQWREGVAA